MQQRGGTLKEAFEATHAALVDERTGTGRSSSTACPSTSPGVWDELSGIEWPGHLDRRARPRGLGAAAGHDDAGARRPRSSSSAPARSGRPPRCCWPAGASRSIVLDQRPERDAIGSKAICQQRDVLDVWEAVGAGAPHRRRGRHLDHRAHLLPRHGAVQLRRSPTPAARPSRRSSTSPRPAPSRSSTSAIAGQPLIDVRWGHQVIGVDQDDDRRHRDLRADAGPRLRAPVRSWSAPAPAATSCARMLGVTLRRALLRRPVPDLRHPRRAAGLGQRAAVLLRPGVEPGPAGAHPPLPGLDVPHRLAGARRRTTSTPRSHPAPWTRGSAQIIGDRDYEIVWKSVYRFHSRCVDRMRVGRVLLAGDAAHLVVPVRRARPQLRRRRRRERRLEARVRRCAAGRADALLDSYHDERHAAARGEPRRHHRDHGLPRPAGRGRGRAPARRARPRGHRPGRAGAGRLRAARRAVLVRRLAADHADPRPAVRRPAAARRRPAGRPRHPPARRPDASATGGRPARVRADRPRRVPAAGRRATARRRRGPDGRGGATPGPVRVLAPRRDRPRRHARRRARRRTRRGLDHPAGRARRRRARRTPTRPRHRARRCAAVATTREENDHGVLPASR